MISGTLLREARRRGGLSQAELARRVGRAQTQIARWERGAVLPSLETLRLLIRACGLELTAGLVAADDSYAPEVSERLRLLPAERLDRAVAAARRSRELRIGSGPARERVGPLAVLAALEAADVPFILIGSLAGTLRGSPLVPVDASVVVVPADESHGRVASSRPSLDGDLAVVSRPPGTSGYRDLRRDATAVHAGDDVHVLVASLADLIRIAEASPDPAEHAQVTALRATLELAQTDAGAEVASGA